MTLQTATQQLYDVFSSYPKPTQMDYSPVKDFREAWRVMRFKALRDLSADDLWQYAFSALSTWGNEQDFRHFLPRLLELMAITEIGAGNEIFARKLPYAKWRSWPNSEQTAIEDFLMIWWQTLLSNTSPQEASNQYWAVNSLCTISNIVEDIEPFLSYWDEQTTLVAKSLIAYFINENASLLLSKNQLVGTWPKSSELQVRHWLSRPCLKQNLEAAFFSTEDELITSQLSEAVQNLEWLQQMNLSP